MGACKCKSDRFNVCGAHTDSVLRINGFPIGEARKVGEMWTWADPRRPDRRFSGRSLRRLALAVQRRMVACAGGR